MTFHIQCSMWNVFKLVFLFVGVVIGAGFATGSEIVLYFSETGVASVIFSAFLMGIMSIVFCYFGKVKKQSKIVYNLLKIVVFCSSLVTYCVMISGSNEIILLAFNWKYFGIATAVIVAILMLYDMKIIKLLNVIIVPCIVLIMVGILLKSGVVSTSGFNAETSLKYTGMNMLLGGYFMAEEGERLTRKQIFACGGLVFLCMGVLMVICYYISLQGVGVSMPLFEVAKVQGLAAFAGVVIYLAIFTTLIGSGRAVADFIVVYAPKKILIFALFLLLGVQFSFLNFAGLVEFCYGMIGEIGMYLCVLVVISTLYLNIKIKLCNTLKE